MRVALVTETYPPEVNGVAHTLRQLAEGLRTRGHAVTVVRPRQPREHAVSADVLVPALPLPRYPGLQMGLPSARALTRAWRHRRPDAVYVATEGPLGWSATRVARRLGIPVVSGVHTHFPRYLRHYGGAWLEGVAACYLRAFHNRTAATVVATPDLRRQLERDGYRNVHVVGRGVDTRLFSPARRSEALRGSWNASAGDLVALHVGRIAPEKNVPLAIEAGRAMQRADARVRLVVVGDGPLRASLATAHPDVVFCGVRRGEDLATHYASADVLLFPSETETFGNVVLEAFASGLILLAYDYAAAHAHVAHGENGFLVPCGHASEFAARAVAVAREATSLGAVRTRARETAQSLDWDRVVGSFEHILESVARSAGAAHVAIPLAVTPPFREGEVA